MTQVVIERVTPLPPLLESRAATGFDAVLNNVLNEWGQATVNHLAQKRYPPPPANSRYVRTGTLGRSFGRTDAREGTIRLRNTANQGRGYYPVYVISEQQAAIHAGRWWTMPDVIRDRAPQLEALIKRRLERVFK